VVELFSKRGRELGHFRGLKMVALVGDAHRKPFDWGDHEEFSFTQPHDLLLQASAEKKQQGLFQSVVEHHPVLEHRAVQGYDQSPK
jgi:hypothetical protein